MKFNKDAVSVLYKSLQKISKERLLYKYILKGTLKFSLV